MDRKALILLVGMMCVFFGIGVLGCAGQKPMVTTAPAKIQPISVEVASVERLNPIAAKPPYQATDVLVFRVIFKLNNPNNVLAKVDDLYFEAKIDDGTPEKAIILAGSMPATVILPGGENIWSQTDPLLYGKLLEQILTRGAVGAEGVKGSIAKRDELWTDLGADKMKFFIDGNITSSLPDFPKLGIDRQQFKTEFAIPKL